MAVHISGTITKTEVISVDPRKLYQDFTKSAIVAIDGRIFGGHKAITYDHINNSFLVAYHDVHRIQKEDVTITENDIDKKDFYVIVDLIRGMEAFLSIPQIHGEHKLT
jgi:hypothetical protein